MCYKSKSWKDWPAEQNIETILTHCTGQLTAKRHHLNVSYFTRLLRLLHTYSDQRLIFFLFQSLPSRLPYRDIFGGVSALTKEQFLKLNGFSNLFWGWGGEDDDMAKRIRTHGFHISRYPHNIARYTMLKHRKQKANPKRYVIFPRNSSRWLPFNKLCSGASLAVMCFEYIPMVISDKSTDFSPNPCKNISTKESSILWDAYGSDPSSS